MTNVISSDLVYRLFSMLILASKIPPKTKLSFFISRAEMGERLFFETEGNELKILQLTGLKFSSI